MGQKTNYEHEQQGEPEDDDTWPKAIHFHNMRGAAQRKNNKKCPSVRIFFVQKGRGGHIKRGLSFLPNFLRVLNILNIWKIVKNSKEQNVFLTSKVTDHRWEDEGENCQWKRHELPTAVEMATLSKQEFLPRIYWKKGERGDKKILARVGLLRNHYIS